MLGHPGRRVNDFMLRIIGAYLLAVLATYVAAAVLATQSVLARLADMGVAVSFADRLATTARDLVGMAPMYGPIIAVALILAFPVAALVLRWRPDWRWFGYPLAGGVALLVVHLALEALLNIVPVAAARSALGLAGQVLCGVLGGWVFLRLGPASARR
jgi:hypothetical protein